MRCISSVTAAVLVCVLSAGAQPQQPIRTGDITVRGLKPSDFPRVTKLTEHVYAYEQIDPTKRVVTANNLIVITDGGVLVAEGQGTVDNVRRLVADIAKLTPQPIKYVVVGSEHGDHIGGDSAFPDTVTFLVHPSSKAVVEARIGRPVDTVSGDRRMILLGTTQIDVLFLGRAHTGGDLEVYVPGDKILFMSEVFLNRIFPSMANGFPSEWIETLKRAEQMDAEVFVPAHGFVDSPAVLKEEMHNYRLAIGRVVSEGRRLHDARVPVDAASDRADFGPYTGWTRRSDNAAGALKRVYMQLDGQLR
jgi:glyoxylase-like metal-dependent hydrolase (beta-lactamase superfamily II)